MSLVLNVLIQPIVENEGTGTCTDGAAVWQGTTCQKELFTLVKRSAPLHSAKLALGAHLLHYLCAIVTLAFRKGTHHTVYATRQREPLVKIAVQFDLRSVELALGTHLLRYVFHAPYIVIFA